MLSPPLERINKCIMIFDARYRQPQHLYEHWRNECYRCILLHASEEKWDFERFREILGMGNNYFAQSWSWTSLAEIA